MPVYSHSQLSTYEDCPHRYKLHYIDKIQRDVEGVEAFLGTMVHGALKKCYDNAKLTKLNTLDELILYYEKLWQQNWHDKIIISKKDMTKEHYLDAGKNMLRSYYDRHAPFTSDITVDTEMRVSFPLDVAGKYRLQGYIDRLSRTPEGTHCIHDYKTSGHLPSQEEADKERQLALYQIGVQKRWPDVKDVRLVWHYLAFDRDIVSTRSEEAINTLASSIISLIDQIQSAEEFPPRDSGLCEWCEYPDLCPMRKHFYTVEALPANEYLNDTGVVLVNRYVSLKEASAIVDAEMANLKEAMIEYARREGIVLIRGSSHQARVKVEKKLKFPGKNDDDRLALDDTIIRAGKWPEVSQLDTFALTKIVEQEAWGEDLIEKVMKFGHLEETSAIYLSKLKNSED